MLAFPSFLAPATMGARWLNKLLEREQWARQRLARYSGKTVRFVLGRLTVGLTVLADGRVQPSGPAIVPDVTLTVPADRLAQLADALRSGDPDSIAALLHVQGDAGLANVVSGLARELRWDLEDDLSRVVGDVAAIQILKTTRAVATSVQRSSARLTDNIGEYLAEEGALVLGRDAYNQWSAQLQQLQRRLQLLEHRAAVLDHARRDAGKA